MERVRLPIYEKYSAFCGLVALYFKMKDIPQGWGFGKEKSESEKELRKFLKKEGVYEQTSKWSS